MAGMQLPPGLRFHPTDVELIKYYLKRKVLGKKLHFQGILELDIYKHSPWDLPDKSGWRSGDLKWYFFCPMERKYASGARVKRSTDRGYWKTTGKDRSVSYNDEVVGMIKTLVFHQGKPPKGERTDWVMYEYRLQEKELAEKGIAQDAYVICSIFKKEGPGPRNGAQYGAPFREEDWNDDDDDRSSIVSEAHGEQSAITTSPVAVLPLQQPPQPVLTVDEIGEMLNMFSEEAVLVPDDFHNNEVQTMNCPVAAQNAEAEPYADGMDIFGDLGDLGSLVGVGGPADNAASCNFMYPANSMVYGGDAQFVELLDLDIPIVNSAEQTGYIHTQAGGISAGQNVCASGDSVGACGSRIDYRLATPPGGGLPPQMSGGSRTLDNHHSIAGMD